MLVGAAVDVAQEHPTGGDVGAVFEGTAWSGFATTRATFATENGRIDIELPPGGSGGGGLVSRCAISGDFDVQVDYRLTAWPTYGAYSVGLITADFSAPWGVIGTYRTSSEAARRETYSVVTDDGIRYRDASDFSGTLRLVRSAAVVTGYHSDSSASSMVGSGLIGTSPTRLAFVLVRYAAGVSSAAVTFERFTVNAGEWACQNATER